MKKYPAIIVIIFLFISIFPWNYGIYWFFKGIISIISIYYCIKLYNKNEKQDNYFWFILGIVILFNPIIPIYLFVKTYWIVIDIITIILYIQFINKYLN